MGIAIQNPRRNAYKKLMLRVRDVISGSDNTFTLKLQSYQKPINLTTVTRNSTTWSELLLLEAQVLAREILDRLVATGKHEVIALVRKEPSAFPELPGVTWTQSDYTDKSQLVELFRGVETVLSFIGVHLDPGNETQKRIIDACVEAGVKRFAPSEWATGEKLVDAIDAMSWYSGKIEVQEHLRNLNAKEKVLEYTLFQPGGFMDYLCHPHKTAKYITTSVVNVDFVKKRALIIEGTLDDEITYTSIEDIANIVTRAVDLKSEWPVVGGISGDRVPIRRLLEIGQEIRGEPFAIEWLKMQDIEAGELKTDNYPRLPFPSVPKDQVDAFSKMVVIGTLTGFHRGAWTVSGEWNKIFSDYKFTKVEELLKRAWEGKA
ncbi:hypothetical protein F53441_9552 [Fusarium austroafricanum]|uniref:NmrA-like domain-containing protein n=1 Tax=Fusarium austroafricanum TaxID=2364996 RepID=A0A8H4KCK7_9HYPO|nr:hypothetical protein F53441_9552 [Fusarium austroafricanum]